MSRFTAPPPNGDNRKAIEQRAREATRPAAPEKKGCWPFSVDKNPFGNDHAARPTASSERSQQSV